MKWVCNNPNCHYFGSETPQEYGRCAFCNHTQEPDFVLCTKIVEAVIPNVGRREIGRIYDVPGRGSFYTITKEIQLPFSSSF